MHNQEISKILFELAELYEMKNVPFKPRALLRASETIDSLGEDVADIYKKGEIKALENIPGVGRGIAEKIEEYLKTGHIKEYEHMKKKMPVDIAGLSSIEGVGPKLINLLYTRLRIRTVSDLEKAAKEGKLRNFPSFAAFSRSETVLILNLVYKRLISLGPTPSIEERPAMSTGIFFFICSYSFICPVFKYSSIFSAIPLPTPGIFSSALISPFL